MILIIGATGKLGGAVAKLLLHEGKSVRAMTRTPEKAEALKKLGAEVVAGDLREPGTLAKACAGVTKLLAASHSFLGRGNESPQVVNDRGNRNLIDAAKAARVEHFVFTSALGARPDHPVDFFRIKYKTEVYLQNSGLSYTILRPAAFMDDWAEMIGKPIVEEGKTTIFGQGKNPMNYVAMDEVVRFAQMALEDSQARNQVIEIGGPENLTIEQVVEVFERLSCRQAKRSYVPLPVVRVMKTLLRPLNPGLSRQITAGINMDTTDQTFDMTETLKRYPVQLTKLEDFVRTRCAKT
jgi:NADH dehydrogenase